MSETIPEIGVIIRAEPIDTPRRRRAWLGQGVRLHVRFFDRASGAAIAVEDPVVRVTKPMLAYQALPLMLEFPTETLIPDGEGMWHIDVLGDVAGTWIAYAACTAPRAAAAEAYYDVVAIGTTPPAVRSALLVTEDLSPLVTQYGGVLTAQRIDSLPEAVDPDGFLIPGVQRGESKHMAWSTLAAAVHVLAAIAAVTPARDAALTAIAGIVEAANAAASASASEATRAEAARAAADAARVAAEAVNAAATAHIARVDNPHATTAAQIPFVQPGTGAVARDVADVLDDTLSVKSFGAKGDARQHTGTITVTSTSLYAINMSGAPFSQADVGKAIIVSGLGAGGAPLVSTITQVTTGSRAVLAHATSGVVTNFSAYIVIGTDDAPAINRAIDELRKRVAVAAANGINCQLEFPSGIYLCLSAINYTTTTGASVNGSRLVGLGALLYGATGGEPVLDAMGTYGTTVEGLAVYGDRYLGPRIGIQFGRVRSGIGAFGRNCYRNVTTYGYFGLCGLYALASETSLLDNCNINNSTPGAYAYVNDGCNHWGLTSQWTSIDLPVDEPITNTVVTHNQCKFVNTAANSSGAWLAAVNSHLFENCYWNGTFAGVTIFTQGDVRSRDLHMSGTIEHRPLYDIYFDGVGASAVSGFSWHSCATNCTQAVLGKAPTIPVMKLWGARFYLLPSNDLPIVDVPAEWEITGDFAFSNLDVPAGWQEPALFRGRLITQTADIFSGSVVHRSAQVDASRRRVDLTNGGSDTIPAGIGWVHATRTATIDSFTFVLPTPRRNGQLLRISTTGRISSLTLTPHSGATVEGWIDGSPLPAHGSIGLAWDATTSTWVRTDTSTLHSVAGLTGAPTAAQLAAALAASLPTTPPSSPGIMWNNGGTISIS